MKSYESNVMMQFVYFTFKAKIFEIVHSLRFYELYELATSPPVRIA